MTQPTAAPPEGFRILNLRIPVSRLTALRDVLKGNETMTAFVLEAVQREIERRKG